MDDPCCHRCEFDDVTDLTDEGCCAPMPVSRSCLAPTLPATGCDEEAPVMVYDAELDSYSVLTTMYDNTCSALLDSTGSPLISKLA